MVRGRVSVSRAVSGGDGLVGRRGNRDRGSVAEVRSNR
jgi:hypothetical protein